MKIFVLILLTCNTLVSVLFSKEIKWQNISIGVSVQYNVLNDDFGKYWHNSFGFGANFEYTLSDNFSVEGDIYYSRFKGLNDTYPVITFINIPGGLKYYIHSTSWWKLNLFTGLENNTFSFKGVIAKEVYGENTTESEFGFFISIGSQFIIGENRKIEIFAKGSLIFSSPEYISMYNVGVKFFLL